MKRWNDWLVKTKMFTVFSAVSLFIVILTCVIFYYKNVSDIKGQTFALSDTITRQFNRTFELYIQDIERLSVAVIGDPVIQTSLIDHYRTTDPVEQNAIELTINNRLFTHFQPRPELQSIYVFTTDKSSYYVAKAGGPKNAFSLQDEDWYKDRADIFNNKFMLLPVTREDTGNGQAQVISFVRNINRIPYRDVLAYMKININVKALQSMLINSDSNDVERNMRMLIVTDDGHIVYDDSGTLTGTVNAGLAEAVFKQNRQTGEADWDGSSFLYTRVRSDYTKWNTVILIPSEFLLSKLKRSQYILLIVGVLAMLLIAVVSYLLSHHMTLPLRSLMKKMNRVELGDFSQRMEISGNNEIGRLSRIYNNMLDSISRLIREAYESRLAEKNAQLSALQAQINPHFLYNTLNIMKSISRIRGIEEVAEMSESLAELFQYSMNNLQHPVSLRDELNHIGNYMNIQEHRFGSRFELVTAVPHELLSASVLKLTIQPLVENAIIHGMRRIKSGGRISLRAIRRDGTLVIEVADNGEGIEERRLWQLRRSLQGGVRTAEDQGRERGIGLGNIGQRIRLKHGEPYGIELESRKGSGTTVRLIFPLIEYEDFAMGEGAPNVESVSRGG